jgi:hypothetical protein
MFSIGYEHCYDALEGESVNIPAPVNAIASVDSYWGLWIVPVEAMKFGLELET